MVSRSASPQEVTERTPHAAADRVAADAGPADGDPTDDWNNYPTSPANSEDMDIDLVPTTDVNTRWAPALPDAVWARKNGGSNTPSDVYSTSTISQNLQFSNCGVTPSRKLTQYSGTTGASNFQSYVNTIDYNGNTYPDDARANRERNGDNARRYASIGIHQQPAV